MTFERDLNATESATVATLDTVSKKVINLQKPDEAMIEIQDIANGLSNICRFGGQIGRFYSVAQHSCLVSALCPPDLKRAGLLHDASEAFLGDVIRPLKSLLGAAYKGIEFNFETVIFQKFGLDMTDLGKVKKFDLMAYDLEDQALRQGRPERFITVLGNAGMIVGETEAYWRPLVAKMEFLRIFTELFNDRSKLEG